MALPAAEEHRARGQVELTGSPMAWRAIERQRAFQPPAMPPEMRATSHKPDRNLDLLLIDRISQLHNRPLAVPEKTKPDGAITSPRVENAPPVFEKMGLHFSKYPDIDCETFLNRGLSHLPSAMLVCCFLERSGLPFKLPKSYRVFGRGSAWWLYPIISRLSQ